MPRELVPVGLPRAPTDLDVPQLCMRALWWVQCSAEIENSHSIGSAPSRARASTTVLGATVSEMPGSARPSLLTTSWIERFRNSAIPMTSQTTCSAGNRRVRSVAVPVASSACKTHSGSTSRRRSSNASGLIRQRPRATYEDACGDLHGRSPELIRFSTAHEVGDGRKPQQVSSPGQLRRRAAGACGGAASRQNASAVHARGGLWTRPGRGQPRGPDAGTRALGRWLPSAIGQPRTRMPGQPGARLPTAPTGPTART